MTVTLTLPFRSSRGLVRGNPLLGDPCVALDVVGLEVGDALRQAWSRRVESVADRLGWPAPRAVAIPNGVAVTLTFTVPPDQWRTAREANEWALCASVVERDPSHWSGLRDALRAAIASDPGRRCAAAEIDETAALTRLVRLAEAEAEAGKRV